MIVMFFHCKVQAKKKQEKKKQIQFRSLICEIRSAEVPVYRIFYVSNGVSITTDYGFVTREPMFK